MHHCPSEERLAVYAANAGDDSERQIIETHLVACARCRSIVARDQSNSDWLQALPPLANDIESSASTVRLTLQTTDAASLDAQASELAGVSIPGYCVLEQIGRGGQAVIYRTIQESTGQTVAIKVPREGHYITKSERRRFQREVELVTQLKHPNIIAVFDSGLTRDGRKFYVMDFVDGRHLNRHVRDRQLALEQTLELFAAVCDAVQFAHQHGVIHRDLKPSNILVDDNGDPKVLDFGLARSITAQPDTIVSASQELLGTLQYMSPEQTRGNPDDVDTRTDVYALGVIFYELLTGQPPYTTTHDVLESLRIINEAEPLPPSRLWTPQAGVNGPAAKCPLDGEVQTILLKALEKDPQRRYQSAGELAEDIRHYLVGEPLSARPPTLAYLVRKWTHRHRLITGLTAGLAFALVAGLIATVSLLRMTQRHAAELADTVDAMSCSLALSSLDKTTMSGWTQAIVQIDNFISNHPHSRHVPTMRLRRADELASMTNELELGLARHEAGGISRWIIEAPDAVGILRELVKQEDEAPLLHRVQEHLEASLLVPPPLGAGQDMLDIAEALRIIDPASEAAADFEARLNRLYESLPLIAVDRFDETPNGALPVGWESDWPTFAEGVVSPAVGVSQAEGGLVIKSDDKNLCSAHLMLPELGTTTNVKFSLTIELDEGVDEIEYGMGGGVMFNRRERQLLSLCFDSLGGGWTASTVNDNDETSRNELNRPIRPGEPQHIEVRIHENRDTCDILINGEFACEESKTRDTNGMRSIGFGCPYGTKLVVHGIEVRSGDIPFKLDTNLRTPTMRNAGLNLNLAATMHAAGRPYAYTRPESNRPLLLMGDNYTHGQFECYQLKGSTFEHGPPQIVSFGNEDNAFRDFAAIDGLLGIAEADMTQNAAKGSALHAIRLCEFSSEGELRNVFTKSYIGRTGDGSLAAIHYRDGRQGFVYVGRHPINGYELFSRALSDSSDHYVGHGLHDLEDIQTIATCDWDGDGGDDLFLGLGRWDGYCPALIVLDNDRPGEPVRLTPNVGITYTTCCSLDGEQDYLVAASCPIGWDGKPPGPGFRVWRVRDIKDDGYSEPLYFEPGEATAVASGTLDGREVFVVSMIDTLEVGPERTAVQQMAIRAYGLEKGVITCLWEARYYDTMSLSRVPALLIADINGDGNNELVVTLNNAYLHIFATTPVGTATAQAKSPQPASKTKNAEVRGPRRSPNLVLNRSVGSHRPRRRTANAAINSRNPVPGSGISMMPGRARYPELESPMSFHWPPAGCSAISTQSSSPRLFGSDCPQLV